MMSSSSGMGAECGAASMVNGVWCWYRRRGGGGDGGLLPAIFVAKFLPDIRLCHRQNIAMSPRKELAKISPHRQCARGTGKT